MSIFYLKPDNWPVNNKEPFLLDGSEAKHLAQVLRLGAGDEVTLFDGQGRQGRFVIKKATKSQVQLSLLSEQKTPRPLNAPVLALAFTKALKRSWIMEKAVEFHAAEIWVWQAERSQGKMAADSLEHWQNQLVAGAKQSENPWLPTLKLIKGGAAGLAENFLPEKHYPCLLWEEQSHSAPGAILGMPDMSGSKPTIFIIGPEGGITAEEAAVFTHAGAVCRSLGDSVLRYETAAMLCLGLSWWSRQSAFHSSQNDLPKK